MAATMPRPLIRRVPLFSYFGVVYGVSLVALAVIGLRSLHRTTTQPAALVTFPVMVITVGLAGVGRTRAVPLDRSNRPGGHPTRAGCRGGASHRGSFCSDSSQSLSHGPAHHHRGSPWKDPDPPARRSGFQQVVHPS